MMISTGVYKVAFAPENQAAGEENQVVKKGRGREEGRREREERKENVRRMEREEGSEEGREKGCE